MGDDLPVISLPTDSTKLELGPPAPAPKPAAPVSEVRRAPPIEVRKPAPAPRPNVIASPTPPRPISAPVAPAPEPVDDDPEKLLREYTERQKTKIVRLEQQLVETKKILADRDALKAKAEAQDRELARARQQLDAAAKQDEVIKDLQGKIDAAILSNGILTDDKEKLKRALGQQTENFKRAEDRASAAEKALAESQKALVRESEARQLSEGKIAAALHALSASVNHGSTPADKRTASGAEARPEPAKAPAPAAHAAAHAAGPKPAVAPVKK